MADTHPLQKALDLLQHADPAEVEVIHRPDGRVEIHYTPQVAPPQGKWARIAAEMAVENLLGDGSGEVLRQHIREFRENFALRIPGADQE